MSQVESIAAICESASSNGAPAPDVVRLNIGAGGVALEGYVPIDRKQGTEAFPLDYPDESVDEIRASHVLEHFSHRQTADVLADWARVLKPGGVMAIAVPDFDWIITQYMRGVPIETEGYIMGGHDDADDVHGALFSPSSLTNMMHEVGIRRIGPWKSDIDDCAAMDCSLNLRGVKCERQPLGKVVACMSTPRLGFMDNFFCAYQSLLPNKIELRKHTGAFWDQCLERCIEQVLDEDGADAVLTIDYDTIYTAEDVATLVRLAEEYPDADAICALQASRSKDTPLMTIKGDDEQNAPQVPREFFDGDLAKIHTGHFGLTLIRKRVFETLPKPWFVSVPGDAGSWQHGSGKLDADIYFWAKMAEHGLSLHLANRVVVGHGEFMVRWPGQDFQSFYQHPHEYNDHGKPKEAWT